MKTAYPKMSKSAVMEHNKHDAKTDKIKNSLAKPAMGMAPSNTAAAVKKGAKDLKYC